MSGPTNDDLTNTLNRRAEDFARLGGHDLDLSQVVNRAGEIRRGRRMRASMVMAAVAIAVAVPVGITVLDNDPTRTNPDLPIATNSVAPSPSPTVDHSPITLNDLQDGAPPKNGVLDDGTWTTPGGSVPLKYDGLKASDAYSVGNGLLIVGYDGAGGFDVHFVDPNEPDAQPKTWSITGDVAVSAERNVGVFVQADGTVTALQDNGSLYYDLGKIPAEEGAGLYPIQVSGENCSGRSEEDVCDVLVRDAGTKPATWLVSPHHAPRKVYPDFIDVIGTTGDGRVGGMVSSSDSGSCSEVRSEGGTVLWKTCDYRLESFSPSGDYVLASGAYGDGAGASQLAVLDANTGKTVLDLKTADGAFLGQPTWEDDSHVLVLVSNEGEQYDSAVQRFALDGTRVAAVPVQTSPGQGLAFIPVLG